MTGAELLAAIQRLRERLLAHERYFAASEIVLGPRVSEDELAHVEARLGVELPALLRDFYCNIAGSLSFSFSIHEEAWLGAGYAASSDESFAILAPSELHAARAPHLVPFTSDLWGNGWCLDRRSRPGQVVWHAHDDPDGEHDVVEPDVDAAFADVVENLLGRASVPAVIELLRSGNLPAPPRRQAPAKRPRCLPHTALERDAHFFALSAALEEEAVTAAVALGATRLAVAGPKLVSVVDVAERALLRTVDLGRASWALAAHSDGRRFVVGGEHGLSWLSLDDEAVVSRGAGNVTALAMAGDGHVAMGTRKGHVELWSFASHERSGAVARHDGMVTAIAATDACVVSLGQDGVMRASAIDGTERWRAAIMVRSDDGGLGPRLLVDGGSVLLVAGQLDVFRYDLVTGHEEQRPDASLPAAGRLRCVVLRADGSLLAGRAGARLEAWSPSGAWLWTYLVDDGSEVAGIAPLADGRVAFASSAGWVGCLDPAPVADVAQRRLALLSTFADAGLAAAASAAGLDEADVAREMAALERTIGVPLFEAAPAKKGRRERDPVLDPATLNERAIALLCQD
jgi:hypothetical protein